MAKEAVPQPMPDALPPDVELPTPEFDRTHVAALPADIYSKTSPGPEEEQLVKYFLEPDVYDKIIMLANDRNVSPVIIMRNNLSHCFAIGGFECGVEEGEVIDKDQRRTGNDNTDSNIDVQRLKKLICPSNLSLLGAFAKPVKLSNKAALNRGLRHALANGKI